MIDFDPIDKISFRRLVDLLVPYLDKIQRDLIIIGNQMQLNPADDPFLLVLNKKEKRIGIIEILKVSKEFPGQILAHASWVEQNSYAIANLNKNDFNPDLPPFIIGLTPSYPPWLDLLSYIKLDIQLFKYRAMTFQGSPVLIFDPLFEPAAPEMREKAPQPAAIQSIEETAPLVSPVFHHEGIYETGLTGLTEEEIRYFSN